MVADKIGVSKSALASYERGETEPTASALVAYQQHYGANLSWLLSGEGSMFDDAQSMPLVQMPPAEEFVRVPIYDVKASAGHGRVAVNQLPVGDVAFTFDFLRRLGANPDSCYAIEARGDSMWPTIPDGAFLIADASQTDVDDGRIYHFNVNDRVVVKRARWRMDGRLYLTSDNISAGISDESFAGDRIDDLYVGGRIVFVGHAPLPVR